ncbi:MAG: IS110 family transposase, partial [Pyrinomonadaceae bacterium]|nr:IS110 family transposase [Pyrinomonadaceae bacterium]
GLLTSLCLVHTLGELNRFSSTRKVAAYVGFDPVEHSSAERKVYGGISKAGSRLLRYLLVEAGQTACKHDEQLFDDPSLPEQIDQLEVIRLCPKSNDESAHVTLSCVLDFNFHTLRRFMSVTSFLLAVYKCRQAVCGACGTYAFVKQFVLLNAYKERDVFPRANILVKDPSRYSLFSKGPQLFVAP